MQINSLEQGGLRQGSSRGLVSRPLHACCAPLHRHLRRGAVVTCAAPSKQEPESETKTNSSMPRLPPRTKPQQPANRNTPADQSPPTPKSNTNSSRSRPKRLGSFAGGPNQPPPSELLQSVMQEKALAGLLAYTGLMGTAATAVAFFNPGIDLFGGFHWDAADVSLALKLMLPMYGLNLLIMLPNYSSWKMPEVSAESQAAMVEAIAKWSAKKGSKGKGGSASSSSSTSIGGGAADQIAAAAAGDAAAAAAAASGSAEPAAEAAEAHHAAAEPGTMPQPAAQAAEAQPADVAATADAAPAGCSRTATEARTAAGTPTPVASSDIFSSSEAEDSWLSMQLRSPSIMRMRDALYMAQGHYLSINPAVVLPLPLQAVVLLADCLAVELLYRSVALQLAGGWIGDRIVEAGADDVLESLLAGMPVLPTHASGQLVAVALFSAAWGVAALRNMRRMARRPQLVLGAQGRQAAGQLLSDMQDRHRREQRQQQQQQQKDASNSSSSSSSDASSTSSDASSSTAASQPDIKASSSSNDQQQSSASRAAAEWAVAAAKSAADAPQQQQQQQGGPTPDPQWSRRLPSTLSALALSQLVQGARDIGQVTALGLSFVLTGNLAAPFAAAVVNQVLMAALQKRGLERARQKSIAMAKHLAGITRQLRDAQRKQEEKKRQEQQQGEQQQLAASADAVQDAKPEATAADGAPSSRSDTVSTSPAAAVIAQDALASAAQDSRAAATAAASPALDSPAVLAATAAARDDADSGEAAVPVEAAPAAEALVASRMERTINVLDQLLGQLGEHATAGPGPGK